ncbi:hypothetical protein GCM10023087_15260 [Microbacterium rhizosphaerae]
MDGPWNPPSSLDAAAIIEATWIDSLGSSFGAPGNGATGGQESRGPLARNNALWRGPRKRRLPNHIRKPSGSRIRRRLRGIV